MVFGLYISFINRPCFSLLLLLLLLLACLDRSGNDGIGSRLNLDPRTGADSSDRSSRGQNGDCSSRPLALGALRFFVLLLCKYVYRIKGGGWVGGRAGRTAPFPAEYWAACLFVFFFFKIAAATIIRYRGLFFF